MSDAIALFDDPPPRVPRATRRRGTPDQARRLKRLREEAGFPTAASAAAAAGINQATYHHYENGFRPITQRAAKKIAEALGVSPAVLLFGQRLHSPVEVGIVGSLGSQGIVAPLGLPNRGASGAEMDAQARIAWFADPSDSGLRTAAPPGVTRETGRQLAAITVDTQDAMPVFCPGDELFYRPTKPSGLINATKIHNRRCIVVTVDGEVLARIVIAHADGSITLLACGVLAARRLAPGTVVSVWPILWTKHADPAEIL